MYYFIYFVQIPHQVSSLFWYRYSFSESLLWDVRGDTHM